MDRRIRIDINGAKCTVVVGEAELVGPADGETTWQIADVEVALADWAGDCLAAMPLRAGAYLDGATADQAWSESQDGARAMVSLFVGLPIEPEGQYGLPMLRACGQACSDIGAAIGAAIREAADAAE